MVRGNRWAGMLDVVRLFSPPVPPLLFVSPERFFSPILGILFTLYPLNFFTCFVYSLASLTVQFFCRWDNDVFILHTTRRPVPLNCAAPPGERPRAQPVITAGFEPACRYHPGGTRNAGTGYT